ncbi:MAG: tetratricopeptide repeat protein, partial [Acidobacteriota bacterium]
APTAEQRLAKAPTQREKDFLASLEKLYGPAAKSERDQAYHDALQEMYGKYPGDHEVASLYALSILGLTNGNRDFRNYMRAASIAEEVFAENPRHPGAAHYLIHSYDDPIHAPLGLRAARVYNKIAPNASHAQHMISHIYVALGHWDESSTANEKAWAVSQARVKRKKLGINQLDFHSFFWLHYSYLQQGRHRQAQAMLQTLEEARQSPEGGRLGSYYGRMRAQQVIETQGRLTSLPPSGGGFHDHFGDALEALYAGRASQAESLLGKMAPENPAAQLVKKELQGLILLSKGSQQIALGLLREAAAEEDGMPLSYGPPMPSKPTHELLGEVLLRLGRPAEAQHEFEAALQRAPRRALSLLGLARSARQAGAPETAAEAEATLRAVWKKADPEVLELLEGLKEAPSGATR